MKVAAFRAILEAAAKLYRDGGNDVAAHALSLVARLLSGRDAMTVPAFATLIGKISDAVVTQGPPVDTATVAVLQTTLGSLATFCETAAAKTAAKDLSAFADALGPHAGKTVGAFCAQAEAWLSQEAEKPKGRIKARSKATAKQSATSNEDAIKGYLDRLRSAGTDRYAFEAALERLKADKSLKSPDVAEIARRYADTVTKYKSMAAAHSDISKAFIQQARFANKVGQA